MVWADIRDTYLEAVVTLPDLVAKISDFTAPGLGTWNLGDLCGHLVRAVKAPVHYLSQPEPVQAPGASAAAYFVAYLRWREEDPARADRVVAERGRSELAGVSHDYYVHAFNEAVAGAHAALQGIRGNRKVATPFGPYRIQDYLRTRTFEVVVHGLDVRRAAGTDWQPPDAAIADALHLTMELARATAKGSDLLLALTGRDGVDDVIPILR